MGLFAKTDTVMEEELVPVQELPEVQEASAVVRKAKQRLDAATAEARKFSPGTMTLGAVTAAGELENSDRAYREAQTKLKDITDQERKRIHEARAAEERAHRRELLAALENAKEFAKGLHEYQAETVRLAGGRRAFEGAGGSDWAEQFLDDVNRDSTLTVWRRFCEREGLL